MVVESPEAKEPVNEVGVIAIPFTLQPTINEVMVSNPLFTKVTVIGVVTPTATVVEGVVKVRGNTSTRAGSK